jgi:hypothetical protein
MKQPKHPKRLRPGQVWAKIAIDRRGVRRVISRTVLWTVAGTVWFTPKRMECRCLLAEWWRWAKGAHLARMVHVPCKYCNGTGRHAPPFGPCPVCKGRGHFN